MSDSRPSLWPAAGTRWARVRTIEWRARDPTGGDPDVWALRRQAALTAAWGAGTAGPLAGAWIRQAANHPIEVWVGSDRLVGAGPRPTLSWPPAVLGVPADEAGTLRQLETMRYWRLIDVQHSSEDDRMIPATTLQRPSLEDSLGDNWAAPMALIVLARPLADTEISEEIDRLELESRNAAKRGAGRDFESEAITRRYAEVRDSLSSGLWQVAVSVGATTATDAGVAAALVASGLDLTLTGWRARPGAEIPAEDDEHLLTILARGCAIAGRSGQSDQGTDLGRAVPTGVLTRIMRPPLREAPGTEARLMPDFDVVPAEPERDRVPFGVVLDHLLRPAGEVSIGMSTLNRHTFVCGATGGGKSQTVRHLLEQLSRRREPVPWMVIEPAKAEYRQMWGRIRDIRGAGVVVITPGAVDAIPVSFNPLEPASLEPGNPALTFPLQSHADLVRALFLAAFEAHEPFPQVLSRALTECYRSAGWDLVTGAPRRRWPSGNTPRLPTLRSLQEEALRVVDSIGYGEEMKNDVRGFVDVRIGSLRLGTPGRFFEGGHPVDFAALLRRNVVLEIETVTNDQDKAFVIGALLIRLYEQLLLEEAERKRRRTPRNAATPGRDDGPPLRHVTVIEEAHRLLRNVPAGSPAAHSLELFASLLAEVRAYREGLVVAEQIPAKLVADVIKNTAFKIVHRLPAADDRQTVGATMNLSEAQSAYVVTLNPGEAAVFADGMDRPMLCRMPTGEDREEQQAEDLRPDPPLAAGGRFSSACGGVCRSKSACTLATMRAAENLVDDQPLLTIWVEMATAAHILGYDSPSVADGPALADLRSAVAGTDGRLAACVVAHAVERAITSRYELLAEFYDPDVLSVHLAAQASDWLTSGITPDCAGDRERWRAGYERHEDLARHLRALVVGQAGTLDAAEFASRITERGLDLGTASPADQLARLESLPWARWRRERRLALLIGDPDAPAVHRAAAALAGAGTPAEQLRAASDALLVWRYPSVEATILARIVPPQSVRDNGK